MRCKVDYDRKSMAHAKLLSRGQFQKDGRTVYPRLIGMDSTVTILDISEQVMAQPLRSVGLRNMGILTLEQMRHIVVFGENGIAISRENCSQKSNKRSVERRSSDSHPSIPLSADSRESATHKSDVEHGDGRRWVDDSGSDEPASWIQVP